MEDKNSPRMLRPEPTQGEDLLRLTQENARLQREAEARAIEAFVDWATGISAQLIAAKGLLQTLGVSQDQWQKSVDEAKRSSPQDVQPSLQAFAELLRKLSEQ